MLRLLLEVLSTWVIVRLEQETAKLLRDEADDDGIKDINNIEALGLVRANSVRQFLENNLPSLIEVALEVGAAREDE